MRRAPLLLAVVALVLVALATAGRPGPGTAAQNATPAAGDGHPLVGSWLTDTDADDPTNPPSLSTFHADGTYLEVDAEGVGVGAWEPTGERTAALTFLFQGLGEDGAVFSGTVRATVEVAEDGQSFAGPYTIEFAGIPGLPAGELGPGTATGERIAVEPMGTPVASLAEAFGGAAASPEATPAG